MTIQSLAQLVGEALLARGWMLATTESCTGGGIAAAITEISGSSQWFERGFVTYSNQAKQDMLGVTAQTLDTAGAVSEASVLEMVTGTLAQCEAQVAVAVSGVAGPTGGTPDKPVGMVCLAWALQGQMPIVVTEQFSGDRQAIRAEAVERALQGLLDIIRGH